MSSGAEEAPRAPMPNSERSTRTRRGIQAAAVDCFHRRGFLRTTVDDIVQAAGVTKGAFYHHFKSKKDVLARIQEDLLRAQLERFEQIVASNDRAADRLQALVAAIIHTVVEDRAAVTIWTRDHENLEPKDRTTLLALREQLDNVIADTIAAGVASGEFRPSGDPRVLALGIIGMAVRVQEWYRPDGESSLDSLATVYAGVLLDGLRAD